MNYRALRTFAVAALILGVVGQHRAQAAGDILRGIASMAQGPVGAGTILFYEGANLVQSEPYQRLYNGTFSIRLNEAAASALAAGVLRVAVEVDQTTTLVADLGRFNPATRVLFINPVTTITAAYRNLKPATAVTRASGTVAEALGIASPAATACEPVTGFNGPVRLSAGAGGFNAYVQSVARQVAEGRAPNLRGVQGVPLDFRDFFLETASDIFGEALGKFPGVGPLAGWILGQIYSAPNESAEERQQISAELSNIFSQLNQILDGITQLSSQIESAQQAILDKIKLTNYQNDAATAQTYMDSLCDMQTQLMFLAEADPNQNNIAFAEHLQGRIQNEAGVDLKKIWGALEGNGVLGTRSLINEWSDLVGTGPNASIFANVSYLKSAVPNLQYYLGAVLVGYNLQIEQAHWLELNGAPDLAKSIVTRSSSDFEQHDDTEMKLVAHDQEIGGPGTTGLYAAVLPPFFAAATQPNPRNPVAYSTDPTNSYNWSIDLRSGLMWMRNLACDGGNCTFAMYDKEGGFGSGVELAQPYLSKVNATLNTSYPGDVLALTAPSRAQWVTMVPNNRGFFGGRHLWTSDVFKEAPGPRLFPAWENWFADTSWYPERGSCFNPNFGYYYCPQFSDGEPTDPLWLVSVAPLADPYHFLYRSHQDDFSMNVFTAGPAMNVARADATVTPLLNGKVLIAGGRTPGPVASTELYDPATGNFAAGPSMNTARWAATATLLPNGKVLIAGGVNSFGNQLKSTELYDPVTNTFAAASATASMNTPRRAATATSLADGKVLIVGGVSSPFTGALSGAELYDPYANTFAPADFAPTMKIGRVGHTATLLPNGKVLIAGGSGTSVLAPPDHTFNSTELYDPTTNAFTVGPAMQTARRSATATLLPNGKVLIAGGQVSLTKPLLNSTELYDPATNTFTAGPAMNSTHSGAAAILLPNGKVLIAGDFLSNRTDLYDPVANSFTAGPLMNTARGFTTAVVLPDSQVLIPGGGATDVGFLASTLLYTE